MKIDVNSPEHRVKMFGESLDRIEKSIIDEQPFISDLDKMHRKYAMDSVRDSFKIWLGSLIEQEVPDEA